MNSPILHYVVLSDKMSIAVNTDRHNVITFTAPITKKFTGQPLHNLIVWLTKIKANPTLHCLGQTNATSNT